MDRGWLPRWGREGRQCRHHSCARPSQRGCLILVAFLFFFFFKKEKTFPELLPSFTCPHVSIVRTRSDAHSKPITGQGSGQSEPHWAQGPLLWAHRHVSDGQDLNQIQFLPSWEQGKANRCLTREADCCTSEVPTRTHTRTRAHVPVSHCV